MSRFLEVIFVLGCSLVGLGIGSPAGSRIHDSVEHTVQLVSRTLPRSLIGIGSLAIQPGVRIRLLIMKHVL